MKAINKTNKCYKTVTQYEFRSTLNRCQGKVALQKKGDTLEIYGQRHALIAAMRLPSINELGRSTGVDYLLPLDQPIHSTASTKHLFLAMLATKTFTRAASGLTKMLFVVQRLGLSIAQSTKQHHRGVTPKNKQPVWVSMRLTAQ